jgi:uncharacterized protein (TIGR02611 family)
MKHIHDYVERLRRKLRLDKLPAGVRKAVITIVGGICLAAGIVMLVTPGPAFVLIPLGLLLLASEFKWAERAADRILQAFETLRQRWRQRKERRAQLAE